jgi:protein phosphatase 2C family protein 2/3
MVSIHIREFLGILPLFRNYNEDRVSIILNIAKPDNFLGQKWPKVSYFGIFDGHGGNGCAEFLRDNLHKYVINDANILNDTKKAIISGFEKAENDFFCKYALNHQGDILDRSGSCAITLFILGIIY